MATIRSVMLEQVNPATNTYKAYRIDLNQDAEGWSVACWNGRIGAPLKPAKVALAPQPDQAKAEAAFEKVLKGQIAKTYKPVGEGGAEMVAAAGKTQDLDLVPTRPAPFTLEKVDDLDPRAWLVQQKHDGHNRPVRASTNEVVFASRKGIAVPAPADKRDAFEALTAITGPLRVDSEDMGAAGLVIFDVVEGLGVTRADGFARRNAALAELRDIIAAQGIAGLRVDVAVPLADFLAANGVDALRGAKAEGFVLKHRDGDYNTPGWKVKFYEDATFRVAEGRDALKASMGIESWDEEAQTWVHMGNVTVPANAPRPAVGSFLDVTYLYAFKGGAVYQPIYKGLRDDVSVEDCALSKLKFKDAPVVAEPETEEMEP